MDVLSADVACYYDCSDMRVLSLPTSTSTHSDFCRFHVCVCVCACCFNTDSERILLNVLWHLSTSLDEELEGPEGDGVVRSFRIRLGYIQQQLQQQPGSY